MPYFEASPCAASRICCEKREAWLSRAKVTGRMMGSLPAATSASLRSDIHSSSLAKYSGLGH
eukprot:scaffold36935_cov43-Tisochrysis_lutea.AAC.1